MVGKEAPLPLRLVLTHVLTTPHWILGSRDWIAFTTLGMGVLEVGRKSDELCARTSPR